MKAISFVFVGDWDGYRAKKARKNV